MKKIDTFSAHSLKVLEKSLEEFENKFIYNLSLFKKDPRALLGQKFHNLICAYLNDFNIEKMSMELNEDELIIWKNLVKVLETKKQYFIKTEYPFLIKCSLEDEFYYLTGRFDAILQKDNEYIIYDWKTLNLPKNPENDLQTITYLYCASKIFNSTNIKIRYLSIEKLDFIDINFRDEKIYKQKIDEIILKYYKKEVLY